jgi:hypothetical protein
MIHFGAFRDGNEVERHLLSQIAGDYSIDPDTTTREHGRVKGHVLRRTENGTVREPIDAPRESFINEESSDGQRVLAIGATRAFERLKRYADEGYEFEVLQSGTCGEVVTDGTDFLFSAAKRDVGYFDLMACAAHAGTVTATYYTGAAQKAVAGLAHSGDINRCIGGQTVLMHSLCAYGEARVAICAVGYSKKELAKFAPACPVIAFADASKKTLWIPPFKLDVASIGESTLIVPLIIDVRLNTDPNGPKFRVRYIVPDVPPQTCVDTTGAMTDDLKAVVSTACREFDRDYDRRQPHLPGAASAAAAAAAPAAPAAPGADRSALSSEIARTAVTVVLANGLDFFPSVGASVCLVEWGDTLVVSATAGATAGTARAPSLNSDRGLYYGPIITGSARGAQKSLLLCARSPSALTEKEYTEQLERVPSVVFAPAASVREADASAAPERINGILVIVGDLPGERAARENIMREISAPVMRLMGPCAVVLCLSGDKYYFYGGAALLWPMFAADVAFGDEVAFSVDAVASAVRPAFRFIVDQADRSVFFQGRLVQSADIIEVVRAVTSVDELEAMRPDLRCAFTQLGVVLDSTETRDLRDQLVLIVRAYADRLLEPITQAKREAVRTIAALLADETEEAEPAQAEDRRDSTDGNWPAFVAAYVAGLQPRPVDPVQAMNAARQTLARLRGDERKARGLVQPMLDEIGALCSMRAASSKKSAGTLQDLQRGALIAERVKEAENLTSAQYADLLALVPFFAIADVSGISGLLAAAASTADAMEKYIVAGFGSGSGSELPAKLGARCPMLESDTIAAVLECKIDATHVVDSTDPMSIAFAMPERAGPRSYVPFELSTEALGWSGGFGDWMELANAKDAQLRRIKFREMWSSNRAFPIESNSQHLSMALVAMTLSLAQSIAPSAASTASAASTSSLRSAPAASTASTASAASRDDTTQQMLRGLMYLLFTYAAAGSSPTIYVFQLTQPHATLKMPASVGEWHIYAGVLEALRRMVVSDAARTDVVTSACSLLVKALRRGYVDPITAPMRSTVRASAEEFAVRTFRERDEKLQWGRAAFLFLRAVETDSTEFVDGAAAAAAAFFSFFGGNAAPAPAPARPLDPGDACFFFELGPVAASEHARIAQALLSSCPAPTGRMCEYRRALKNAASGKAIEAGPRLRAAHASYFCRFSGVFADAKHLVHSGADVSVLDQRREQVARFLRVESVDVPNYGAFKLDKALMAGDEELARLKWADAGAGAARDWCSRPTRGYAPLTIEADRTWMGLLGAAGITGLTRPSAPVPGAPEAPEARPDPLTVAVTAVDALGSLDSIFASARLPHGPISRMFAALGLDADDARHVLRMLLLQWRDVNAADEAATRYLVGRVN